MKTTFRPDTPPAIDDPDAQTRAIVKAHRRLARALDLESRRIGRDSVLTLPQLIVLGCARDLGEGATTRAVAAAADVGDAAAVAILDRLEAKGLIARRRGSLDRRVVHTALTHAGRAALAAAPPPLGARFAAAFAALPAVERAALAAAMARVADLAAPPPPGAAQSPGGGSQ